MAVSIRSVLPDPQEVILSTSPAFYPAKCRHLMQIRVYQTLTSKNQPPERNTRAMITVVNAAPDTGNQGVTALCLSAVAGLAARKAGSVAVADHGRGLRQGDLGFGPVDLVGLTHNRRFWRQDNLSAVRMLARIGGGPNPTARLMAQSRAVLDISGGDSFTDLYGPRRFRAMTLTKSLAIESGVPLILLPQTLGPWREPENRRTAASILRRARSVWVRDAQSLRLLSDLLGRDFDPAIHRQGIDMAVALPARAPTAPLPAPLNAWLADGRDAPVAGLNVSGLLALDPEAARTTFSLADGHDRQIAAIARAVLMAERDMRLVLIPHVHRPLGAAESDLAAAQALARDLANDFPGRVAVLDQPLGAMQLKWVLSRLDWFAGARMHATIGAFSSGVPTLGLGYSDKQAGVFAACGIGTDALDLRRNDTATLATRATESVHARHSTRAALGVILPGLRARAETQMDDIVAQALAA
jgi:polysaccharide pyruvyl transferase WcaK-like protein